MNFLTIGPENAHATMLLAHGAGAAMDSPAMEALSHALAGRGFRVVRFEFDYMAARRNGARKPPPKAELLIPQFEDAVSSLEFSGTLIIGGKSMGGRVASMLADRLYANSSVAGLLCLGYPFHPPGKPEQKRTAHLENLRTPALIVQGSRDPFGTAEEVRDYNLSRLIELFWLEDGDHDLRPRKSVSGHSISDHLDAMAAKALEWEASIRQKARFD